MFYPEYYKINSNDSFRTIYVMYDNSNEILIEILVSNTNLNKNKWIYKILDTLHNYKPPYLFSNMFFAEEKDYIKISKNEFVEIYDNCFNQFRHYCL